MKVVKVAHPPKAGEGQELTQGRGSPGKRGVRFVCVMFIQTVQAAAFQAVKPSLVTHLAKTNREAGERPWSTQGPALKKHSSDSQQEEAQAGASRREGTQLSQSREHR